MHANSEHTTPYQPSHDTVVSGTRRVVTELPDLPELRAKLGCAGVVILTARDVIRHAYAERLTRRSDVYGVSSSRELVEVLENIAAQKEPLGGLDMVLLDARGPSLSVGDAVIALETARWAEAPFVLFHEETLFCALGDGPLLVMIVSG